MYQLNIEDQTISIEGKVYNAHVFRNGNTPDFANQSEFHHDLFNFLKDWFSEESTLNVLTSGSTGTPKTIIVEKTKMMNSAQLTCSFLGLKKSDTALLCMPLKYIGGKMFVVRAIIAGLDLYPIAPCGNPLKEVNIDFDFAAMITLQVYNSLQSKEEKQKLQNIKNLIIGGGAIDDQLSIELESFPNKVYSTYGMTETLSHIALRRLSGKEASDRYKPFDSVKISRSEDGAIVVDAPLVSDSTLYTNDIAEIFEDDSFRIIGRKDNIINSGGVKIQTEEVERLLKPFIKSRFAITSLPDPKFGEIVVLVNDGETINTTILKEHLPSYYIPKKIFNNTPIPLTETGKIDRPTLKKLIHK